VLRLLTLAASAALLLAPTTTGRLAAQDEKKPESPQAAPADAKPAEPTPAPAQITPPAPPTPPTVPPEVEAKLEAARRAVAEAIVAAQDAGLVDSSIDPPPILDILINGYANDHAVLKAVTTENPEAGLSPEVFGAWFTGYGKPMTGITPEKNVKIVMPSRGLKAWYDKRAEFLNRHIAEVRKAQGSAAPPTATPTPAPTGAAEAPAPAPTEEPKAEAPAPAPTEEPKAEAPAPAPADEPKTEGETPKA
jgi:hypothetical protein